MALSSYQLNLSAGFYSRRLKARTSISSSLQALELDLIGWPRFSLAKVAWKPIGSSAKAKAAAAGGYLLVFLSNVLTTPFYQEQVKAAYQLPPRYFSKRKKKRKKDFLFLSSQVFPINQTNPSPHRNMVSNKQAAKQRRLQSTRVEISGSETGRLGARLGRETTSTGGHLGPPSYVHTYIRSLISF